MTSHKDIKKLLQTAQQKDSFSLTRLSYYFNASVLVTAFFGFLLVSSPLRRIFLDVNKQPIVLITKGSINPQKDSNDIIHT